MIRSTSEIFVNEKQYMDMMQVRVIGRLDCHVGHVIHGPFSCLLTTSMVLNVITLLRKAPSLLPSDLHSVLDAVLNSEIDRKILLQVSSMRFMGRFDPESKQYTDVGSGRGFSKTAADWCLKELVNLFPTYEEAYLNERAQALIEGVKYNHFPSKVTQLFAIIIQGAATLMTLRDTGAKDVSLEKTILYKPNEGNHTPEAIAALKEIFINTQKMILGYQYVARCTVYYNDELIAKAVTLPTPSWSYHAQSQAVTALNQSVWEGQLSISTIQNHAIHSVYPKSQTEWDEIMTGLKGKRAESRALSHDVKLQASIVVDAARRLGYTCFYHAASRESVMFQIVIKKCIEYMGLRLGTAEKCLRANIEHQEVMPLMPSDGAHEAQDSQNIICMSPFLHSDMHGENPDDYLSGRCTSSLNTLHNLNWIDILQSGMGRLNHIVSSKKDTCFRELSGGLIIRIKDAFIDFLQKNSMANNYVLTAFFSNSECAGIRARVSAPFGWSKLGYEVYKDSPLHALGQLNQLS